MTIWRVFLIAITSLRRYQLWIPLLVYFVLKVVLVLAYAAGASGPLGSMWAILLPGSMRDALSHYPGHLLVMPAVMSRIDIAFDILVHIIFQGATIFLFVWVVLGQPLSLGRAFRSTLSRYAPAVGVTLIAAVVLYVVFLVPGWIAPHTAGVPPLVSNGIAALIGLVVQAFFVFTLPLVLLSRTSVFAAVRGSFSIASEVFGKTFVLVLVPFLLTLPELLVEAKAELLVARLSPDVLVHIQVLREFSQFISTLLLVGGLTILFIEQRGVDAIRRT